MNVGHKYLIIPINVKAFILIAAVLLTVGCKNNSYQPSASEIGQIWLDIKTEIDMTDIANSGLYVKIEELDKIVNSFFNSPIGYMYRTHRRGDMRSILEISAEIKSLENAVKNGNEQEVKLISHEIDKAVNVLQRVDADLSGVSLLDYFILFFFIFHNCYGNYPYTVVFSRQIKKGNDGTPA